MIIRRLRAIAAAALVAMLAASPVTLTPAIAQVQTIDPNDAIDADLMPVPEESGATQPSYVPDSYSDPYAAPSETDTTVSTDPYTDIYATPADPYSAPTSAPVLPADEAITYQEDDLIGAAEGVFGKGAEGLAGLIEDILRKQGEPNAYIVGREAGGAFVVGLRYGSGTMYHKVEGQRDVYWTGPSIGFDAGANAGNTFVLVYNLYDSEDLYRRYPAGEGAAYLVGGFNASYMRRGDVVLIPVRMGVGARLGVNAGYMKFSEKQRWLPF